VKIFPPSDVTIFTVEVHVSIIGQKEWQMLRNSFSSRVTFIVLQKVAVAALLCSRACRPPRLGLRGPPIRPESVYDLLDEGGRLHQAHAIGNNEFSVSRLPDRSRRR